MTITEKEKTDNLFIMKGEREKTKFICNEKVEQPTLLTQKFMRRCPQKIEITHKYFQVHNIYLHIFVPVLMVYVTYVPWWYIVNDESFSDAPQ
jgi:hypothetical protein